MKMVGVIPARYASTRLPGKPLADICGKPMIWWVWNVARQCKSLSKVYIATDSKEIDSVCAKLNIPVVITGNEPNATDRAAAFAEKIKSDVYVIVMGDEPLLKVGDIDIVADAMKTGLVPATMLSTHFNNPVDVLDPANIKLSLNAQSELVYMSRSPIPFPKAKSDYEFVKHAGVYAFTAEMLAWFRKTPIGRLEAIEDMEMLRFLENHKIVYVCHTNNKSLSVDTPKNLDYVRGIISASLLP